MSEDSPYAGFPAPIPDVSSSPPPAAVVSSPPPRAPLSPAEPAAAAETLLAMPDTSFCRPSPGNLKKKM